MKGIWQLPWGLEGVPDEVRQQLLAHCPAEFLEVQGIHLKLAFLGGNDDILYMSLDGDERPSLHEVVSSISDKVFDHLACLRIELYLVKHDERFTRVQWRPVVGGQKHEERIKVIALILEDGSHVARQTREVDDDARAILIFCELLDRRALADAPRSLDKKGFPAPGAGLPSAHVIKDFSLKHQSPVHAFV